MRATPPALLLLPVASILVAGGWCASARADAEGAAPVAEKEDLLLVPAVEEAVVFAKLGSVRTAGSTCCSESMSRCSPGLTP